MSEPIPDRLRAALADRYELHEELGAGGMATVYLADDIKHERKVAVKVLRPELAAVIGGERFIAEIKTTAALQHPHILPLFDSGEADSFLYYVMPYVEGESLRKRIDRERQLEVEEAVHIAKAVASALQYAHERDIIHRDIKPENILLHAGEPVVADFGIALAISAAGGGRMTETGLSLGTPHYMSPEQAAADRDLSARSDVYSVACVLYEMLGGQPPHTGPTAQSILVRILTEDPRPVGDLRPTVPRHLRAVVAKGLEKLPADRFKSAEEFKAALDDESFSYERVQRTGPVAGASVATDTPALAGAGGAGLSKLYAAAAVFFAATTAFFALRPAAGPTTGVDAPLVSFVLHDSAFAIWSPAVSVDGTVAWVEDGQITIRAPGALEAVPIQGIGDADGLAFSPAGDWIAFITISGSVRKVQTLGGGEATLWDSRTAQSATPSWGDDGYVYFTTGEGFPQHLARVPDVGGEIDVLVERTGFTAGVAPIPGGRAVAAMLASGSGTNASIYLIDVATGDTATLVQSAHSPRWSASGHLLYIQGAGTVWALPFDPERLEATGAAAPVLEGVGGLPLQAQYHVSSRGTLVYGAGASAVQTGAWDFALWGLDGSKERLPLEASDHWDAKLSPDGAKLAYIKGGDVRVFDLDRGSNNALSTGGRGQHNPVWSPDGTRIAYDAGSSIIVRSVDDPSDSVDIGGVEGADYPTDWPDDDRIVFQSGNLGDLLSIPAAGGAPTPLLDADWTERAGVVSPDGRWIAYGTDRSGQMQIYVRSWPDLANEVRVSEGDGSVVPLSWPVWSPDNRTLYYHKGQSIYAAELDTSGGFRVAQVRQTDLLLTGYLQDGHPDGRLLVVSQAGAAESQVPVQPRVIVSTNWFTELRARLGAGN